MYRIDLGEDQFTYYGKHFSISVIMVEGERFLQVCNSEGIELERKPIPKSDYSLKAFDTYDELKTKYIFDYENKIQTTQVSNQGYNGCNKHLKKAKHCLHCGGNSNR